MGWSMTRQILRVVVVAGMLAVFTVAARAQTQQMTGCFVGDDLSGGQAHAEVTAERIGDWAQIVGQIRSTGLGQVYRFTVDGHSGAGRVFISHEYEAGAAYMQIRDLSETRLIMEIDGYGTLRLARTGC